MWVPKSVEEIEAAAKRGDLEETSSFDAKRDLPVATRNASLAVDVAAMTPDGGVLLYGVGEDEHKRPTITEPIPLAGAADRVAQIVASSISEVPYIDPREYPCDADPSKGYLLVIVPMSARAPHQVTVGGDLRYYGRGPKGNRILTEGEVARLYQRRDEWNQNRATLLEEAIRASPVPPEAGLGYVHAFARPVVPDQGMWERVAAKLGDRPTVLQALLSRVRTAKMHNRYSPTLDLAVHWNRRGADEWRWTTRDESERTTPRDIKRLVEIRFNIDGRGLLFCGRATDTPPDGDAPQIVDVVIAGNLEVFFAVMAMFYEAAGYHGQVDVGVAITGLEGAIALQQGQAGHYRFADPVPYSAPTFTRTTRVAAAQLQRPDEVAHSLLRHFVEAVSGIDGYNPFTDQ